jgi:hypothetical protein
LFLFIFCFGLGVLERVPVPEGGVKGGRDASWGWLVSLGKCFDEEIRDGDDVFVVESLGGGLDGGQILTIVDGVRDVSELGCSCSDSFDGLGGQLLP